MISLIKDVICPSGGGRIPFCPECGRSVGDDDQFCESCGTALPKTGIPVPPQSWAPPPQPAPPPSPGIPIPPQPRVPPPPATGIPQPARPVPDRHKSAGLAALGSFCFSGLGQVYNGQPGKGVAVFLGTIVGVLLFVVPGIIIWIIGVADAWVTAKNMNDGKIPLKEHSWLQIIAFFIFSFIVGYLVYSLVMILVGTMIEEGIFSDMMMSY